MKNMTILPDLTVPTCAQRLQTAHNYLHICMAQCMEESFLFGLDHVSTSKAIKILNQNNLKT
jgi:hypothetical protein